MKKRILAALGVLLLALSGCAKKEPDEAPPEEEQPAKQAAIFIPDAQAEYLVGEFVTVRANDPLPEQLIAALADAGVLPEDVEIVSSQLLFVDGQFELDLNEAFQTALQSSGSAGETMTLYAVVDTFLFNFPTARSLTLTVGGESVSTDHAVYDQPFTELGCLPQAKAS